MSRLPRWMAGALAFLVGFLGRWWWVREHPNTPALPTTPALGRRFARLIRRCSWCGGPMLPRWWAARYCSVLCRVERHQDIGCGHNHRTAADAWPCAELAMQGGSTGFDIYRAGRSAQLWNYEGPGTPEPPAHGFELSRGSGNLCRRCACVPGAAWHQPSRLL